MRSGRPKILHLLGGQPLVRYPVALVRESGIAGTVVVVAPGADTVRAALADLGARFVEQPEPRGTGDALRRARPEVPETATELLLLYGDVPLLDRATLAALLARHRAARAAATLLTFVPTDPTGYGRVRRGRDGRVRAIVEERDATPAERRGPRVQLGDLLLRPAPLVAGARGRRPARARQRAGRGVPDGRDRPAGAAREPDRGRARDGPARGRRASTTAGSSRRSKGSCARAPSTRSWPPGSRWSIPRPRTSTRP